MRPFLDEDFLLRTKTARALYHGVAAAQPIIDYHCHLSPAQIADDHRFRSMTELWLDGDHYKWRAMRADGVPERAITGDASDAEKFDAWARTVPRTLRNPLYHWTHLELRFPFGVRDQRLGPATARAIYDRCNARLGEDGFSAQGLLRQFGVRVVATTDDPTDSLEPHRRHAGAAGTFTRLVPTFRPDKALALHALPAWNLWMDRLGEAAGVAVGDLAAFMEAIERRHAFFHDSGCRASDHGLDRMWSADCTTADAAAIFARARAGQTPGADDTEKLRSWLLYELALLDHRRGWAQQFHLGAMRSLSQRALAARGPDTGYDAIGDWAQARPLARFLDRLDATDQLARTVVYNLNPADNEVLATVVGCFQGGDGDGGDGGGGVPGKMQYGAAWWFLDQLDGMTRQLDALSNMGLLSRFIGMLTDSRSFLSYSRHEYFRRLLCDLLGREVEDGLLPDDQALLGGLVQDVCFRNARDYFGFDVADDDVTPAYGD
jgi:glucuronate isomerase